MAAPQIVWIALIAMALGLNFAMHGKPREPHHFGYAAVAAAIQGGILYWGGFFS
jgi:hypothetical protein